MPEAPKPAVMVVDDIPSNIDLLVEILGTDYDVRVALDGPSALEDAVSEPPDLILLDIMMPGMDGYEVCARLQADDRTRDIPVIFVTAKGAIQDEVRGFDCGAVDYITKPVSAPVVSARVATHLALRKARLDLADKNRILEENIRLREDVDRIGRHDLKTPLNKIISLPGILMADPECPAGLKASLGAIERAGFTMLDMVNRSLDLVKMEQGTYDLVSEPVDLPGVVEKIVSDLDGQAREKGCRFRVVRDAAPVWASGEKLLCYSMAANLIKNAVEACPEKGTVDIRLSRALGDSVSLEIMNPGMVPEAVRDRFFEKYATTGKKGGTGLGTYSARLMARTMDGDITMTTGRDEGTRIRVTLPLSAPGKADGPKEKTDAALAFRRRIFPDLRLLIADDDPDNLRILGKFLDHPCLHIDSAENGKAAVDMWRAADYDLIFMDVEMPVMDGTDAVKRIRKLEQQEKKGRVTVFALSANDEAYAQTCRDAGFDGYLSKPVVPGDLYAKIDTHLAGKETGTAADNDAEPVWVDRDLAEIMPVFLENKAGQIQQLMAQIDALDFRGIRQTAHKLKGGFNMYGIRVLGSICADLEKAAESRDPEGVIRLGRTVSDRFDRMEIRYR